jgi:hypothetical protein
VCPEGFEDLHAEDDVLHPLSELRRKRPGIRRAMVKLNESFSGEGNAVFTYPADAAGDLAAALANVAMPTEADDRSTFFDEFKRMGGVVEEYVEAPEKHSPSVQLRTSPHGDVLPISAHDQILGGAQGQTYLGCRFPARDEYRLAMSQMGHRIGAVLAEKGVVARFGVDILPAVGGPRTPGRCRRSRSGPPTTCVRIATAPSSPKISSTSSPTTAFTTTTGPKVACCST